jgi:hypothetical protein
MRTVLVVGSSPSPRESAADWEIHDITHAARHVDYVTNDLAGFLQGLPAKAA